MNQMVVRANVFLGLLYGRFPNTVPCELPKDRKLDLSNAPDRNALAAHLQHLCELKIPAYMSHLDQAGALECLGVVKGGMLALGYSHTELENEVTHLAPA